MKSPKFLPATFYPVFSATKLPLLKSLTVELAVWIAVCVTVGFLISNDASSAIVLGFVVAIPIALGSTFFRVRIGRAQAKLLAVILASPGYTVKLSGSSAADNLTVTLEAYRSDAIFGRGFTDKIGRIELNAKQATQVWEIVSEGSPVDVSAWQSASGSPLVPTSTARDGG